MKVLTLTLALCLLAIPLFGQEEQVPFTDNEVLLLRAGKPLYQEREALRQETRDQTTAQAELDKIVAKIAQVTTIRDNWDAAGKDKAVAVADIVLSILEADRDAIQERLDNPVDNAARIAELTSILNEFLSVINDIAPEGRTTQDYINFVQ